MVKSIPNREILKITSVLEDSIDCGDRLVEGHLELFSFKECLKKLKNKPHQYKMQPVHQDQHHQAEDLDNSNAFSPKALPLHIIHMALHNKFDSTTNPGEHIHEIFIQILNELYTDYDFSDLPATAFQRIAPSDLLSELNINLLQHISKPAPQTFNLLSQFLALSQDTSRMVPFIWRGGVVQFAAESDEDPSVSSPVEILPVSISPDESFAITAAEQDAFGVKLPARESQVLAQSLKRSDEDGEEDQDEDNDEIETQETESALGHQQPEKPLADCMIAPDSLLTEAELANAARAGLGLLWSADVFVIDTVEKTVLYFASCTRDKSASKTSADAAAAALREACMQHVIMQSQHAKKNSAAKNNSAVKNKTSTQHQQQQVSNGPSASLLAPPPTKMGRFFQYHTSVLRGASPMIYPAASPKSTPLLLANPTSFHLEPHTKDHAVHATLHSMHAATTNTTPSNISHAVHDRTNSGIHAAAILNHSMMSIQSSCAVGGLSMSASTTSASTTGLKSMASAASPRTSITSTMMMIPKFSSPAFFAKPDELHEELVFLDHYCPTVLPQPQSATNSGFFSLPSRVTTTASSNDGSSPGMLAREHSTEEQQQEVHHGEGILEKLKRKKNEQVSSFMHNNNNHNAVALSPVNNGSTPGNHASLMRLGKLRHLATAASASATAADME